MPLPHTAAGVGTGVAVRAGVLVACGVAVSPALPLAPGDALDELDGVGVGVALSVGVADGDTVGRWARSPSHRNCSNCTPVIGKQRCCALPSLRKQSSWTSHVVCPEGQSSAASDPVTVTDGWQGPSV